MADVSDILRDRRQEPDGLQPMVILSVIVHGALVAFVLLSPGRWWNRSDDEPRTVMTISLGSSAEGPANGGMTPLAARPVQAVAPLEAPRRPEALRPPAAKAPEMTLPAARQKPVKAQTPPVVVNQAPDQARGRTPTRGAQLAAGNAVAETGARGQGFGLSSGGGAGSGSSLDVAGEFCCPDYLMTMTDRIRRNWNSQVGIVGQAIVKFTIQRDGQLVDIELEKSSGYTALDLNARRAVLATRQLPPLPAAFPNPTLPVHLNFQYQQ